MLEAIFFSVSASVPCFLWMWELVSVGAILAVVDCVCESQKKEIVI